MKSSKKALALVLVMIMVLGVFGVPAMAHENENSRGDGNYSFNCRVRQFTLTAKDFNDITGTTFEFTPTSANGSSVTVDAGKTVKVTASNATRPFRAWYVKVHGWKDVKIGTNSTLTIPKLFLSFTVYARFGAEPTATPTPSAAPKYEFTVQKSVDGVEGGAGFNFTMTNGDESYYATTDELGKAVFADENALPAGTYTLSEEDSTVYTNDLTSENNVIEISAGMETSTINVNNTTIPLPTLPPVPTSAPQAPAFTPVGAPVVVEVIPEAPAPQAAAPIIEESLDLPAPVVEVVPEVVPEAKPNTGTTDTTITDVTPQATPVLPKTGGIPMMLLTGLGALLSTGGLVINRRKKN